MLLIAAETGVVGLAATGFLVLKGLRYCPHLPPEQRPWALGLLAGGFHSMLSGTIIMPASQVLLVLCLAMVLPTQWAGSIQSGINRWTPWLILLLAAVSVSILAVTFFLPFEEGVGPRFFSVGGIP